MANWVVEAEGVADDAVRSTIARLLAGGFQIIDTLNDTSGRCSIKSTLKSTEVVHGLGARGHFEFRDLLPVGNF